MLQKHQKNIRGGTVKIKHISIKGRQGIDDLEFAMGSVTVLSGKNAVNKSSVIDALKDILSHSHDPARIRKGSKAATVELKLDNGHIYKMKTTPKSTQWDFRDNKGTSIRRTAELLTGLLNQLSLDPLAFLSKAPKEQARIFTQAIPIKVTAEELGVPLKYTAGIDFDQHALSAIGDDNSGVYGKIYQARTEINRDIKQKRATVASMDQGLEVLAVPANGKSWSDVVQILEQERAGIDAGRQAAINAADETYETSKEQLQLERNQAYEAVRLAFEAPLSDVDGRLGTARTAAENAGKLESTRNFVAVMKQEANDGETISDRMTDDLQKLKDKRAELVEVSPIPGLETSPTGLLFEGVPFEVANLAKQLEISIKIAQLSTGDLGLILVDNMEHLDSENYEEMMRQMERAANKNGLQFVCARVTDSPGLTIENKSE